MRPGEARLTIEDALSVHEVAIARFGGDAGVRDETLLESALTEPWASLGGHDLYDGVVGKTCRCAYDVLRDQPFQDGNRLTGAALLGVGLLLAGVPFEPEHDEYLRVISSVADGSMGFADMLGWVRSVVESSAGTEDVPS